MRYFVAILRMLLGTLAGLAILAGEAYLWFFKRPEGSGDGLGFVLLLIACSGVSIIGYALSVNTKELD